MPETWSSRTGLPAISPAGSKEDHPMTITDVTASVMAQATFGRDGAMFESLLGFVAQLSVVLWSLVILTAILRFVGIRVYRNGAARTARTATVALSSAVPASRTAPVEVSLGTPGTRIAEPRLTETRLAVHLPVAHLPTAHLPTAHAAYSRDS